MFGTGAAGKALPKPTHTRPWISAAFRLPEVAEQNPVIDGALLGSFPPLARGSWNEPAGSPRLCRWGRGVQDGAWAPGTAGRAKTGGTRHQPRSRLPRGRGPSSLPQLCGTNPLKMGGTQGFLSENGLVLGFLQLRLAPVPSTRGRVALLTLCAHFQAEHRGWQPCHAAGVTAGKPGMSKPQLPELSQLKTQEENRREMAARTHAGVARSRQSAAGRTGLQDHHRSPLARPQLAPGRAAAAQRPGDAAGSPPAALRSPSAKPLSRRMRCSLRGRRTLPLPSSRPGHPASLLLSSPRAGAAGQEHPQGATGSRHGLGAQEEWVGDRDSLLRAHQGLS